MMNVDKSTKNEEEFSLFATSQKKFHSKAALEYDFRIEEMFTTTPMNALFLRPPLSPPPPHTTRISSQKRSSNATFRTTTLCVTPRATASSSSSTSSTSSTTNNNSVVNKKKIIVKVQPQQTLSIVSKENGISIPDIVRLNGLGTRRTLQVGEELIVSDFEGNVGDEGVGYKIIERAEMTTMVITSSTDEEKTTVEKEKEIVSSSSSSSSSPSTTSPTDETTTEEKEQNVKKILRLVPENAKEAIMRKIERLKVETTNESDTSTASLVQVVPRSVTASVPFTTSFGVGVGAAVLSMALVATNIGRDDIGKEEEEEEEEEKKEVAFEVESSGSRSRSSTRDSNSSNDAGAPVVKQEEEEAVSVETKLVEKEVVEEVKVTTPLPTVAVVEEKEDVVKVDRSESSPAPLERLKGWMDERDAQENFESSIEEFKAKLAAAQDALIVLQDQLEESKRKKNSQK